MIKQQVLKYLSWLTISFIVFETALSGIFYLRGQVSGSIELYNKFNKANGTIGISDLTPLPNEPWAKGDAIAIIKIPKLKSEQIIFEGSNSNITQKGIGHMAGSAGISERGMSVLVGRRISYGAPFANINKLVIGDEFSATTVAGSMKYKVVKLNATYEDLNQKYNKSMLALVTSNNPWTGFGSYIVIAEAQKNPYPSTPQNRKDDGNTYSLYFIVYLFLIVSILFVVKKFIEFFDKIVAYSVITPTITFLFILFAKGLDEILPPTL